MGYVACGTERSVKRRYRARSRAQLRSEPQLVDLALQVVQPTYLEYLSRTSVLLVVYKNQPAGSVRRKRCQREQRRVTLSRREWKSTSYSWTWPFAK